MTTEVTTHSTGNIPLGKIKPSPYQPREGEDEALEELVESIRGQGLLQPVVVRPLKKGEYECVFGHRRIEAGARLGWKEISAVIIEASPQEAADRLLHENLRRQDLTATDKARFLQRYMADFKLNQTEVGERFGMAQETVSNLLRILNVPQEIQQLVDANRLTGSHVKELLPLSSHPEAMVKRARSDAAPAGKGADQATSVRSLSQHVEWDKQELARKDRDKASRTKAREVDAPKLGGRLLAGLKPTEDKDVPYRDPESGLPLLFGRVRVNGTVVRPVEPAFVNKPYNPEADPELVKALGELGVALGYSDTKPSLDYHQKVPHQAIMSAVLRHNLGVSHTKPCPCGSDHVAVRGWEVDKGDPGLSAAWGGDTSVKGAPKTVIYCIDPRAVNLAVARHVKADWESKKERERQENLAMERFYSEVAPQGGPPVAAFLIGCTSGELQQAEKALSNPGAAWTEICKYLADEFNRWRGPQGPHDGSIAGLQRLVLVALGEATAAGPAGPKVLGKTARKTTRKTTRKPASTKEEK